MILARATVLVALDEVIEYRASEFAPFQIKPLDALHLACAEAVACDYFCTCDDRFLRRARQMHNLKTRMVSPLELVQEIGL